MTRNRISNPSGNAFDLVLSFDDYHPGNIEIAKRLNDIGLKATFFIELITHGARDQIRELHEMGMTIGSHTLSHPPDIKAIPAEECRSELEASKRMIEAITGVPCTSLAYPRGRFNDDVVAMAAAAGYTGARTTHVLKTAAEDPMRTPTTIHVFDGRKEYNGRPWQIMADFYLDHVKKKGGYFHLWGHAREIERDRQLDAMVSWIRKATV